MPINQEKAERFLLGLALLALCLTSCDGKKNATDPFAHVDAQKVHKQSIPYSLNYPALVQGVVDYPVIPRISGVIYKQFYTEGTIVKKGQPLYQIDPRPYQWQLQAYEGQLIKDKAARDNYKLIYDRYQNLYRYKAVSTQDVENTRIQYQAAVGNVKTDEANIAQMKLNLRYCLVRSPANGYIGERAVTVGTMVTAFQTVLNDINSTNQMYLLFSMPENQRLEIEEGVLHKTMTIPHNNTFRTNIELANGKIINDIGYVEFTDTRIALTNGAWNMRAYVDNRSLQNKLLSGQYVTVYITGIHFLNVISLPQEAVMSDDTGFFVYVVREKKAIKQYVKTGKMYGQGLWMITQGLRDNDVVIVKGNNRIVAEQSVVIDKES
jgi:membrane fusion protein (multidrug efflux system)